MGNAVGTPAGQRGAVVTEKDAAWIDAAVASSSEHLQNRFVEMAPLQEIYPANDRMRHCITKADAAVDAAWDKIVGNALAKCRSTKAKECCFERYAPGADYETRRVRCSEACASTPQSNEQMASQCKSADVSIAEKPSGRFFTDAVRVVVERCERDDAVSACASLPTHIERTVCKGNCNALARHRSGRRSYLDAADACAKQSRRMDACAALGDDAESEGFTRAMCEKLCTEYATHLDAGGTP
jgi:hypothetical protein